MNSNQKTLIDSQQNSNTMQQALLIIPQANVVIFSDCIVANCEAFEQVKTNDTAGISKGNSDETKLQIELKELNINQTSQKYPQKCKKIMFNDQDLAFKIDELEITVEIHDIVNHCIRLKFKVKSMDILQTTQTLLRKKMCQLGFETKYKKIKLLGKGSSAQVHLIQRISDQKLFAAKIVSIKQSNDNYSYETFINQSKLLRFLRHRNIIHLESLYIHKKQLIQVMEYLNGGTLLQLIRSDTIKTKNEKWKILKDVTIALDYLRQRRIVHRDIKLENILIRETCVGREYVLSDFGLACWTGEKLPLYQRCGTPGYIAPQVLNAQRGKPILDHKGDIFSLGVIAHIIFLHQSLFPFSGNVKQLLKLNKKADYSLDSKVYKELPLSQKTFLELTLAKQPQQRPNAATLINEFKYQLDIHTDLSPINLLKRNSYKQKISIDQNQFGVQIKMKKQTSLTKKKIDFSAEKINNQNHKVGEKQSISSARKMFSSVWSTLTRSTPKKQKFKVKENSIEKYKQLSEFI